MQEKHEVIKERLRFVRERMKTENVDIFVVFTDDYHMSEYSGAYFADREYLSGFTGSAGTLAVTQTEAALFTDGRYFVQAQAQLEGTGITLMKMGCAGVPTLTEYIRERLGAGGVLGMDARTCAAQTGMEWIKLTEACGGRIKGDLCRYRNCGKTDRHFRLPKRMNWNLNTAERAVRIKFTEFIRKWRRHTRHIMRWLR